MRLHQIRFMAQLHQLRVEARGIEVTALPVRSVLNKSSGSRVAMDLTINPYRGCEFGCRYCYARYTHEFLDHDDPAEFETRIYAKLDAPEVLAKELARMQIAGRAVAIGTATDPYQPVERRLRITRGILEAFTGCRGARLSLLTKSDLVTRDVDLLVKLAERHEVSVGFTMVTLDRDLQRKLEPRAPTPQKRVEAIRTLAAAGLRVGVSYSPILPGVNDSAAAMDELLGAVAEAGASFAFGQPLWIPSCARDILMAWLRENFPERVALYRQLYRRDLDVPQPIRRVIIDRLRETCRRHGLDTRWRNLPAAERQLSLFDPPPGVAEPQQQDADGASAACPR